MTITKKVLKGNERITYPASIFGIRFDRVESFVFSMARQLSQSYDGGYWFFYELSNGGFYMSPDSDTPFRVTCMNGYEGTLSADGLGVTSCLYAYSHLSFSEELEESCGGNFHMLREYALTLPECQAILSAID